MVWEALQPINPSSFIQGGKYNKAQIGSHLISWDGAPDWESFDIGIVAVKEDRTSVYNPGCSHGSHDIRKQFYSLYAHYKCPRILDVGDIEAGQNVMDTYSILSELSAEFVRHGKVLLILGGSHDLTIGQYKGHADVGHRAHLIQVDEHIDMRDSEDVDSTSFLRHMLKNNKGFVEDFTHFGHQQFYNDPAFVQHLDSLDADHMRMGDFRANLNDAEAFFRNAHVLSFDVSAMMSAYAPGNILTSPNGLSGTEACQIFRYAGFSPYMNSVGIYEYNPHLDQNHLTAKQISQMLWYFLEGYSIRRDETPALNDARFVQYQVVMPSLDQELVFWKSRVTERWWMEFAGDNEKSVFVACQDKDYALALENELSDRWMRAFRRSDLG